MIPDASSPLAPGDRVSALWLVILYDHEQLHGCDEHSTPAAAESRAIAWCSEHIGRRALVARIARRIASKLTIETSNTNGGDAPASSRV